eukprot:TRINITY_DN4785_c0_g1_i2.p1 TRINITY_DN4785_c0_g1~~TRINITY_DN4785_c0_g1_i2.p1  ORF type:complete len:546 (+),score=93.71 TRINITY_DN4785_c0_g1_i2:42-1679(+)
MSRNSSLEKDIQLIVLQYLRESNFLKSASLLEQESAVHFDLKQIQEKVFAGAWDAIDSYICSFLNKDTGNHQTLSILWKIRKQKFIELLISQNYTEARNMMIQDMGIFKSTDRYDICLKLMVDENLNSKDFDFVSSKDSNWLQDGHAQTFFTKLEKDLKSHPDLQNKIVLPTFEDHRLRTLINQGLTWQWKQHNNQQLSEITSLLHDIKPTTNNSRPQSPSHAVHRDPRSPLRLSTPSAPRSPELTFEIPSSESGESLPRHRLVKDASKKIDKRESLSNLREQPPQKKLRAIEKKDVALQASLKSISNEDYKKKDLPSTLVRILTAPTDVSAITFHPKLPYILLVGHVDGQLNVWDVNKGVALHSFKDESSCINRVNYHTDTAMWFASAHVNGIVLYSNFTETPKKHAFLNLHTEQVYDVVFTMFNTMLLLISCSADKSIYVWNVIGGEALFKFAPPEANLSPIVSLCVRIKDNAPFLWSSAMNGDVIIWVFHENPLRAVLKSPGVWSTCIDYSGDRLLTCGIGEEGENLAEWDEVCDYVLFFAN